MALSEIFFLAIVLYLLYRFVFNFFIPIFRTTKQVRQQFRNMQDSVHNQDNPFQQQQQPYTRPPEEPQAKKKDPGSANNAMGEYIDFEEIK